MTKELTDARVERADLYDQRTRSQTDWYSKNAKKNKNLFQIIGISIIVLGAMVGVIPLFGDGQNPVTKIDILISTIGALIVILKGIERIWLPEEKWTNYRKASEALLREREKYVEGIEPYTPGSNDEIYRLYVERCILIKAEEQNNFWGLNIGSEHQDSPKDNKHNNSTNSDG